MPFDPQASFGKSLFFGELLEDQLFPYPELDGAMKETVAAVCDAIDKFMASVNTRKFDRDGELPREYIQQLKELGMFGLIVPEEFGGLGLNNTGYARVMQQLAMWDGSTTVTLGAHSSIGFKGLLLAGTKEQKAKYLPKLATGEMIACFCLTEPGSGSDAFSIKTRAEKSKDGKHWILNGQKLWITNGGFADFFTVFAKTSPDTEGKKGAVTAFAVTRDMGGVTHGPHEDKMGIRGSATNAVFFEDVKVPVENVLGEEGKGFKVAMSILNHGRTGLGAGAVGGQKRLLQLATQHANERKQFGRSIGSFGLMKEKLGRMAINVYVSESLCYFISATIDRGGVDYSLEGAATKVFNSEALWTASDEALQIAGGMGYMREPPFEQAMRDARINRIFEGTNEILRLYVGLTGAQKPGEYLKGLGKELARAMSAPIKSLGLLSEYGRRKLSQRTGIGGAKLGKVHSSLAREAAWVERSVEELAKITETLLRRHGKEIVEKQFATRRMGDIAIDLLAMCATLSRTSSFIAKKGEAACRNELDMTRAFCRDAHRRIKATLRATERNNDEEIKAVADRILADGTYWHDILK
ncbi:MAG TPA: acyl-CoA dehydrogenase family protein [bacterium]|nr:acyl-CoA dehydrogenase family protein [bacterium]